MTNLTQVKFIIPEVVCMVFQYYWKKERIFPRYAAMCVPYNEYIIITLSMHASIHVFLHVCVKQKSWIADKQFNILEESVYLDATIEDLRNLKKAIL